MEELNNKISDNKKQDIFMIIASVVVVAGIFITLPLVPALFAYPVIINRKKLLLIPISLLSLLVIIVSVLSYPFLMPFIFLFFAFISLPGILAGWIIKKAWETYKLGYIAKWRVAIAVIIGILVIVLPFLRVVNFLMNP